VKILTHEEYLAETRIFGFIGVYRFWKTLVESTPPEHLKTEGYRFLCSIAEMIASEKQGQPLTSYEAEALEYCGIYVHSEYLQ